MNETTDLVVRWPIKAACNVQEDAIRVSKPLDASKPQTVLAAVVFGLMHSTVAQLAGYKGPCYHYPGVLFYFIFYINSRERESRKCHF